VLILLALLRGDCHKSPHRGYTVHAIVKEKVNESGEVCQ
jgi:hypothetical protein